MKDFVLKSIDIELKIDRDYGERKVDLLMWKIPWPSFMQIDKNSIRFEPLIRVIINMEMLMESRTNKYRIYVPCFIDNIGTCVKKISIIPGFDEPIEIEKGIYNFTLIFKWITRDKGSLRIRFNVYSVKKS